MAKRAAGGMLKQRRGRMIFVSSVVALVGAPGQANYAASKAGLIGLARSIARELGSRSITANVIAPGFIETDMTAGLSDARKTEILANVPLKRYGTADEVAGGGGVPGLRGRGVRVRAWCCRSTAASAWASERTTDMGLLDGKRLLITGVITDASLAFGVARMAQQEGAQVVLTGFGRMSLVERVARKLPEPAPVIELDVANDEQLGSLAERVGEHVDGIDGVFHSIGFAPASCLGGGFLDAPWEDVATAVQVSTYSLKSLAVAALPLFGERGRRRFSG